MQSIYNNLLEWNDIASEFPFIYYKKNYNLNHIIHEVHSLASFLREVPSRYIGIFVDSPLDKILLYIASIKVNKIPVMYNDSWSKTDINWVTKKYNIKHIISCWSKKNCMHFDATVYYFEEILNSSRGCGIPTDLDESMNFESILFTSGTSGNPKAVCLTKENFKMSSNAWHNELKFKNNDNYILCLPPHHIAGLSIIYRAIYYRFKVHILDSYRDINLINNGTLISLVPSMLNRIIDKEDYLQSLRSLRAIVLGGEHGDKELLSKCLDLKLNIFISYGMTETCSGISGFWLHEHPDKIQSAGKAFKGVDISQNNGYIAIKSPMNMKQYFKGDACGSKIITLDKGQLEDDFLYIYGRDESIISGGENISLAKIKNILLKHSAVDDVYIKVYNSKEWGKAIEANIVLNQKITEEDIKKWCSDRLPKYSIPKRIYLQL